LGTTDVRYTSVSQPFELQVPVEDKFLHCCPGHNFLLISVLAMYLKNLPYTAVFLNRWDASRYRDLEAFLPGLELFWTL